MLSSYVKRRRVPRDVPLYPENLLNRQSVKENVTSSATLTPTSQPKMINLIAFGAVCGVILLFMVIVVIMVLFYQKRYRKQIDSGEGESGLIDHARSIDRDDYDDDYVYESELFNDKYGFIVVDTTRSSTVKKDTIKSNIINTIMPVKKSIKSIKSIYSDKGSGSQSTIDLNQYNNNNNNNPPASIYNCLTTRPPPTLTFLSTNNYKQPKDVMRGSQLASSNSFSNLKFATTTTITTTTITTTNTTTNNNEDWFKKPIDSPIIPNSPSRTSLKSLPISNWSKAPWQDDNMTDSTTSSIYLSDGDCSYEDLSDHSYEDEVLKKEKPFSRFSRFSLFRDFKRNNENGL